jgi:hypothetical protein
MREDSVERAGNVIEVERVDQKGRRPDLAPAVRTEEPTELLGV